MVFKYLVPTNDCCVSDVQACNVSHGVITARNVILKVNLYPDLAKLTLLTSFIFLDHSFNTGVNELSCTADVIVWFFCLYVYKKKALI